MIDQLIMRKSIKCRYTPRYSLRYSSVVEMLTKLHLTEKLFNLLIKLILSVQKILPKL